MHDHDICLVCYYIFIFYSLLLLTLSYTLTFWKMLRQFEAKLFGGWVNEFFLFVFIIIIIIIIIYYYFHSARMH